jgi:hypothetical protein
MALARTQAERRPFGRNEVLRWAKTPGGPRPGSSWSASWLPVGSPACSASGRSSYADRFDTDAGGETWFSLLLESWFWIGVPLIVSAMLGTLGWLVAAAYLRRGGRSHPA